MNDQYVKNLIEAALLAAGRPLAVDELMSLFDERDGTLADEVRAALASLGADYETRALELVEVASGYRIQIKAAVASPVSRLWQERPAKYSRALLETLALVAYRQPITRGEIEQIRGVAVNPNIIKTLLERVWILEPDLSPPIDSSLDDDEEHEATHEAADPGQRQRGLVAGAPDDPI
jgi:segregation and condensation protein B